MDRTLVRELAAEFLGTFLLIVFGVGVVAQVVLSRATAGSYLSINLGWGLAVAMGVYASMGVSGGHLNPAVTLAAAVHRAFPWRKVMPYAAAQTAGAFVASLIVFITYREALGAFDGGLRQVGGPAGTASIWATYPQPFLGTVGGFIDQVVGTALLIIGIFAITDRKNVGPPVAAIPALAGALVLLIGATFGYNSGYAINPARDFGPRLFTAIAGWGPGVFTAASGWWWVPIIAPCVGAVLGGFVYDWLITRMHPDDAP
jgi:MIP family channel proteins